MASHRTSSKYYLSTDGGLTWGIWTAWQDSGVKTWTPPQACDCRVKVWARSAGVTTDAAQAEAQLAYVINTPPPAAVTSATLGASLASPQNTGTAVTFTAGAAGGVNPVQDKFFVQQGGGGAQMVRDWSATTSYAWTPTTAASYTVTVWARSAGVTTDAAQAAAQLAYVINTPPPAAVTSATLGASLASPQNTGTAITFTAGAAGGVNPVQYKFFVQQGGGVAQMVRDWSATTSYAWTPTTAASYTVTVWARSAGVTTDAAQAEAQLAYVINTPPPAAVTSATLGASLASPQNTGTAVTFMAGAAGGVNPVQVQVLRAAGRRRSADGARLERDDELRLDADHGGQLHGDGVGAQRGCHDRCGAGHGAAGVCDQHTAAGAGDERDADVQCREPAEHGHDDHAHGDGAGWRRTVPVQVPTFSTDGGLTWGIWTAWQDSGVKTWTPPQACDCRVKVWARSAGVTTDAAQAEAQLAYVINTPPPAAVTSATLGASLASPQNTGTAVTFTAGAAGGVNPVQVQVLRAAGRRRSADGARLERDDELRLDADHGGQLHGDGVGAQRGCHDRCGAGHGAAGVCDQHTAAGAGDERDADVQCREPAEHGHDDHAHGDGAGWRRTVPVQVPTSRPTAV